MSDAALLARAQPNSRQTLLAPIAGVNTGFIVGILRALGSTAWLVLLLPLVFGMDPNAALAMMIGLIAGTKTSDTFPSVLIVIPVTSGAQATVLDGFPMTQRGEETHAGSISISSSLFGGITCTFEPSFVVLICQTNHPANRVWRTVHARHFGDVHG